MVADVSGQVRHQPLQAEQQIGAARTARKPGTDA